MMDEDLKKSLLVSIPLPVLGLGLFAPVLAGVPIMVALRLGLCATIVLLLSGWVIAHFSLRIPKNARIGVSMLAAGGILTIVKIAAQGLLAVCLPMETLVPLVIMAAVLAADGEAYAVKKKVLPVGVDGLGIGISFTVLLVCIGLVRSAAGKRMFAGKAITQLEPFQFFATAPGVLLLTAVAALCIGLIVAFRKKQESSV